MEKPAERVPYRFVTSEPETRDLAEIQAMRRYVRAYLPFLPVGGDDPYHMVLNAWWAKIPLEELESAIDQMAEIGVGEVNPFGCFIGRFRGRIA